MFSLTCSQLLINLTTICQVLCVPDPVLSAKDTEMNKKDTPSTQEAHPPEG